MTAAELTTTMNMLGQLSDAQVKNVQHYISVLLGRKQKASRQFRRLTRDELVAKLDKSEEDIKAGRVQPWEKFREESRKRYGF